MENTVSITRDDYASRKEYYAAFQELNRSYDFKVRVCGGWRFFRFASDYLTWKNQK